MTRMKLDELKDKKVLILGFGREGQDTFKFLRKLFSKKIIGIADKSNFKKLDRKAQKLIQNEKCSRFIELHLGKNYLKALENYDIIIKSPGIPFKILPRSDLGKVTSQTEIFFENCPGKIVGVTGTKGKSTTASLIYEILKSGLKVHPAKQFRLRRNSHFAGFNRVNLIGNIEKPVLTYLSKATPNDVFVYELSSHQLYNLKKSPQIAVFLNIYQEHLDYYKNFKEYATAKANITCYQKKNDYLVYNTRDKIVREIARKSRAKKIPISSKIPLEFLSTCVKSQVRGIRGKFNLQNIMAAVAVGKIFGISNENIKKAIKNFKPLPHRLEYAGKFRGIEFYNDALATIPEATIGALDALGDKVETIMLGGYERNIDFKNLAKRILGSKIKNIILFPTTGEKIWKEILRQGRNREVPKNFFIDNMPDAVKLAYQHTKKGKICLLSCASPSFSIFRDYKEKGNLFKKYVKRYAKQ